MSAAPQLHLTLPTNTTSFKRSFEQFGFDLESPVGGGSGSETSSSSSSSGDSERNKRARSTASYEEGSSTASFSSSSSSSSSRPVELITLADHPPRLPTPEIQIEMQDMDIDFPNDSLFEPQQQHALPRLAIPTPLPSLPSFDDEPTNDVTEALHRFSDFDTQIVALRRSPPSSASPRVSSRSSLPLARVTTPPPILPPLSLNVVPPPTLPPLPEDHTSSLRVPFLNSSADSADSTASQGHSPTDVAPQLPSPPFLFSEEESEFRSALNNVIRPTSPLRIGTLDDELDDIIHPDITGRGSAQIPDLLPHDEEPMFPITFSMSPRAAPPTTLPLRAGQNLAYDDTLREREERWDRLNEVLGANGDSDDGFNEDDDEEEGLDAVFAEPPPIRPLRSADWRERYVRSGLVDPRETEGVDVGSSNLAPRLPLPSSFNRRPLLSSFESHLAPSPSFLSSDHSASSWLSRTQRTLERHEETAEQMRERRRRALFGVNTRTGSPVLPPLDLHVSSSSSTRTDPDDLPPFDMFSGRRRTDSQANYQELRERLHSARSRTLERWRTSNFDRQNTQGPGRSRPLSFDFESEYPSDFASRIGLRRAAPVDDEEFYDTANEGWTARSPNRSRSMRARDASPPSTWSEFARRYHYEPRDSQPTSMSSNQAQPRRRVMRPVSWSTPSPSTQAPRIGLDWLHDPFEANEDRGRRGHRFLGPRGSMDVDDESRPPTIPLPDLGESPFRDVHSIAARTESMEWMSELRSRDNSTAASRLQGEAHPRGFLRALALRRQYLSSELGSPEAPSPPDPIGDSDLDMEFDEVHPPTIPPLSFEASNNIPARRTSTSSLIDRERDQQPSLFSPFQHLDSATDLGERRSRHMPRSIRPSSPTENFPSGYPMHPQPSPVRTSSRDVHSYMNRHVRIDGSRLPGSIDSRSGPGFNDSSPYSLLPDTRRSGDLHRLNMPVDSSNDTRSRPNIPRHRLEPSQPRPPQLGSRWLPPTPFAERPTPTMSSSGTHGLHRVDFRRPSRLSSEASRLQNIRARHAQLHEFITPFAEFPGRRRGFRVGDFMRDEDFDGSYEGLLSLGTILGEVKPRGTPDHVIAGLETAFYKDWATKESDKRCPICLDDYKALDPVLKLANCSHWLHKECLEQWLKGADSCPVCRKAVSSSEARPQPRPMAGPSRLNDSMEPGLRPFVLNRPWRPPAWRFSGLG